MVVRETKIGQKFEGVVTALSAQGFGVVKDPKDTPYFVRGVWPGDAGVFEIETDDVRYGFARTVELTMKSEERVDPICRHSGIAQDDCGGCPWMIGSYESQLKYKQNRIVYGLARAGIDTNVIRQIIPSELELGYRCRAQFKTDGVRLGYAGKQGQSVAAIENCLVLDEILQRKFASLKCMLPNEVWKPVGDQPFNWIDIDHNTDVDAAVINQRSLFSQANILQNQRMKEWLSSKLSGLHRNLEIMEIFCGSGNFTEVIAQVGFRQILAVDLSLPAIEALKAKNLTNVTASVSDIYRKNSIKGILNQQQSTNILVVNPPREGLDRLVHIPKHLPHLERIYYVSCDPVTFTSNIQRMLSIGCRLAEIQPIDQLPHTPHVEIMAELIMERKLK